MIYFHCAAVRQSMVRMRVSIPGLLGMAWVISACAENPSHLNTTYLDRYADPNPTLSSVLECHGFSCSETSRATLNRDAWRQVAAVYVPRAKDARTERRQIAHGVALIQLLVGQQTGTATHQWTHRDKYIFSNLNDPTQLDCIDEAVNTWTYLTLMERNGLLHFHRVAFPCRHPDRPSQHSRTARNGRSIFCDRPGLSRCRSATADRPARELAYSLAAGSSCERGARSFERRNAQVNDFERQPTLKNNIYFEKRAGEAQY